MSVHKHDLSSCPCGKECPYDWTVIFKREGMFYPITGPRCEDWAAHAELNPGTIEIQDARTGQRLWPEGTSQ